MPGCGELWVDGAFPRSAKCAIFLAVPGRGSVSRTALFLVGVCAVVVPAAGCGEELGGIGGDAGGSGSGGSGGDAGSGGMGGVEGSCTDSIDCRPSEYCQKGERCALPGTCMVRPEICLVPSAVCGCDRNDYESECFAAMAGVSVAFEGLCPNCNDNTDCMPGWYCANDESCDAPGRCAEMFVACRAPLPPDEEVCGCDGTTYDSECLARTVGVRVASEGVCE